MSVLLGGGDTRSRFSSLFHQRVTAKLPRDRLELFRNELLLTKVHSYISISVTIFFAVFSVQVNIQISLYKGTTVPNPAY
jgi:hypothetical protein